MDIFISYKKEEKAVAGHLASRLTEAGYEVWWDAALLAGDRFEDEIKTALGAAKAVIVLWSRLAVTSDWVRNEAERARETKKVLPVIIDDLPETELPMLFQHLHTPNLSGWAGETDHAGFQALLKSIEARIGAPGPAISAVAASAKLADAELETAMWADISGAATQSAGEYRHYLEKFGSTARYGGLALLRIERLEQKPTTASPATATPQARPQRLVIALTAILALSVVLLAWKLLPDLIYPPVQLPQGQWAHSENADYGFAFDVPPGFVARGSSNSVYMWSNATLTLSHGDTPNGSFRRQVENLQRSSASQGATITYSAGDRAHFSGYTDSTELTIYYVGALMLCDGAQYAAFRIEYPKAAKEPFNPVIDTLVRQLRNSGWGLYCTNPRPTSGVIRNLQGFANLSSGAGNGGVIARLDVGKKLTIKSVTGNWYEVVTDDGAAGFVSQINVKVDGYVDAGFDRRFIQLVSFPDLESAQAFVRNHTQPLKIYLSVTGWFAVSMAETYPSIEVKSKLKDLIAGDPNFPSDALDTFGNTYVRQM